jgi:hypothetical protein
MEEGSSAALLFHLVTTHTIIRAGCHFVVNVQFAFKAVIVLFDSKVLAF